MTPVMKLYTAPVITSQPPHNNRAARVRSVRGRRRVQTPPAASAIAEAGSSQLICPPTIELNSRRIPAEPLKPPPGPPPALLMRSRPL